MHPLLLLLRLQFLGLGAADIDRERVELRDAFAKLHGSLSLGSVPDSLPCRDEERQRLGGFLNRALHEGAGHTLGMLLSCGAASQQGHQQQPSASTGTLQMQ
jgi:hypothetical protein